LGTDARIDHLESFGGRALCLRAAFGRLRQPWFSLLSFDELAIGESSGDGEVAGLRSLLQKERSLTRAVQ
jgi:hypothetical protein